MPGSTTSYGMVRQSGDHIWVYSEPGMGTTFKVHLPQTQQPLEAAVPKAEARVLGGSETILLLEDQSMLRELAQTW